jgi:transposase
MFALTSELKFHLYNQATDMPKGFDGLSGLITNELELNPCNGDVFIFINKPRSKIKLLHWQRVGLRCTIVVWKEGLSISLSMMIK